MLGIDDYFGWYTGRPGHSVADFDQLAPFLRQSHPRYPHQALVVSEFGAEALYDGPASVKGSFEFQSDYLRRTYAVLGGTAVHERLDLLGAARLRGSSGLDRRARSAPRVSDRRTEPQGPDRLRRNEKPAFAVAASLFEQTPAFAR